MAQVVKARAGTPPHLLRKAFLHHLPNPDPHQGTGPFSLSLPFTELLSREAMPQLVEALTFLSLSRLKTPLR